MTLPMLAVTARELHRRGSFRFHPVSATGTAPMQKGLIDVKPLLIHTIGLMDVETAFRLAFDRTQAMKAQITLSQAPLAASLPNAPHFPCLRRKGPAMTAFFEVHDPVFATYVLHNAPVKRLATGFDWAEGPVWLGDQNCLLFSDIPNDRIVRWSEDGTTTFRQPANYTNGHTRDGQGRLISCQHGTRSVTRTEWDGTITTLADRFDGRPLNSPNDAIVAKDGSIWFTDPHYGIGTDYEGFRAPQELPCQVYRIDPSGTLNAVITDMACPNGLAFSPNESRLYVADTGRMFHPDPQHIRVFDMVGGRPANGRIFHTITPGCADGIRCDSDGNLWSSAGDGVHCIAPDGHLMGKILVPEVVSNVCFGGRAKHRLFITATTSLYSIILNRKGAQWP